MTTHQNLLYMAKALLRGKFMPIKKLNIQKINEMKNWS